VVSSAVLHHRYGLDRGFATYNDDLFAGTLHDTDSETIPSADARQTTIAAINWLSSQDPTVRQFLFLHYIDPHAPYTAPARFNEAIEGSRYLAEVAYTDTWVGKLAVFLQEHELLADTLFVITSDHGEGLGQHGMKTHGYFLYDEVLRVPLIFAGAGVPVGEVQSQPVGLIDIVPTLLSLLGQAIPQDLPGRDLFQTDTGGDERSFVSTSYEPALSYGWSPLWSLWKRGEKFILAPKPEYFDTTADPGELQNLAGEQPERARTLEKILRARATAYLERQHNAKAVGVDNATAAQLQALGYAAPVETAADFEYDDFSGSDPKDMSHLIARMDDYYAALTLGNYDSAGIILDEIEAADPNIPSAKQERSYLFLMRGQEAQLLEWLDRMPNAFRASSTQRYHRAVALGRLGRREEALRSLRDTLKQNPDDPLCRFELAKQLTLEGRAAEATNEYRALLEIDPRNRAGRLNYAVLLKRSGDRYGAVTELRTLIQMHPTYSKAFRNLGLDLAGIGDRRAAIAMLEHAVELAPNAANRARTEQIIGDLKAAL
jgi:predicted Zn-dependent protease